LHLVVARAALLLGLGLVSHRVEHLEERRSVAAGGLGTAGSGGLGDGQLNVGLRASAASSRLLLAGRLLALHLALGLGAVGGLDALVVAFELLADRAALGLGGRAGGVALGRGTDGLALGAVLLLAEVLGAADRANGALAVNGALSAGGLLAAHLALGAGADGVADRGALGVVALPAALGVALISQSHGGGESQNNDDEGSHLRSVCGNYVCAKTNSLSWAHKAQTEEECCPCNN